MAIGTRARCDCLVCAHDCRDLIYEYMIHIRFSMVLELCECVCVCLCVRVCVCGSVRVFVCVNARGCKEQKTTSRTYRLWIMYSLNSRVATM
jgi:hypothetical protein